MSLSPQQLTDGLQTLQAIAFDVDGVLTDGTLTWSPSGEESKSFSFADIMGVSLLRRLGIRMALISGEPSPLVDLYAKKMHIPFVLKGTRDKATALREFSAKFDIPLERTCFFGDDVNDLFAMEIAGLCACPSNAAEEVRAHVAEHGFVSTQPGGQGAVRSFSDAILAARNLRARDVFLIRPPE
ncbi:HAD family hydrolase [Granulicella sp. S156]|uniref:KdsC family phosphatase n=1 Tax=Granulicella sp. S156 TaxID=1747224 RepID=UPI0020B11580|nr:HAD hydrolase family protein [Granulicella sp. S156]